MICREETTHNFGINFSFFIALFFLCVGNIFMTLYILSALFFFFFFG